MTPERAKEILNIESTIMPGFKKISVGGIQEDMTSDEVYFVKNVWCTMSGNSSFHSALLQISRGLAYSEITMTFDERRTFLDKNETYFTNERWAVMNARLNHDIHVHRVATIKESGGV